MTCDFPSNAGPYPPDNFDICRSGSIARGNSIHDLKNVFLHHRNEICVIFPLRHVAKMLDEVHNIGAVIHGILEDTLESARKTATKAYSFKLFKNT